MPVIQPWDFDKLTQAQMREILASLLIHLRLQVVCQHRESASGVEFVVKEAK